MIDSIYSQAALKALHPVILAIHRKVLIIWEFFSLNGGLKYPELFRKKMSASLTLTCTLIVAILISSYLNINLRKMFAQQEANSEISKNDPLCHSKYALNYPVCIDKLANTHKKIP